MILPAGFYGIADSDAAPDVLRLARRLLRGGAPTLQLRMKHRPRGEIRRALAILVRESAKVGAVLVLNDHVDLAAEFPGVGLHLGQDDIDPREARKRLGPERLIGWSTHDLLQIRTAEAMSVDYVGFGPVFSAAGKHLHPADTRTEAAARGVVGLAAAVTASRIPVVAIGGIGRDQLPSVLSTGVHAVAAIGAPARAADPEAEAAHWVAACRR